MGQSLMARDVDRQVAEVQIGIAVLTRSTELGIAVTETLAQIRLGSGGERPTSDLCNKAAPGYSSVDCAE